MALRLKSRNHSPVGGFIVDVPEISNTHRTFWDFKTAANALWDLLRANPGIQKRFPHLPQTRAACDDYVDSRNAQRMLTIPGAHGFIVTDAPPPKSQPPLNRAVLGAARFAEGAANLAGLFGSNGKPVAQELANARAKICAGCPNNQPGPLEKWFTGPAAMMIRKWIGMKNDLSLTTPDDDKLHTCVACDCPMALKVWVSLDYINQTLKPDQRAKLDPRCWILKGT